MPKVIATLGSMVVGAILFLMISSIFGFGELPEIVSCIVAILYLILCGIVYKKIEKALTNSENQKQKKREEDIKRFESGEMTGEERAAYAAKQISDAELFYRRGYLNLAELELLRKKYTGKSFMIDNMSIEAVFAASKRDEVNRAIEQHNKRAEKSMIYSAAIGDAIGGTAGAIVGAVSSAQKSAQEGAALEVEKAKADQAFEDAIRRNFRRGLQQHI